MFNSINQSVSHFCSTYGLNCSPTVLSPASSYVTDHRTLRSVRRHGEPHRPHRAPPWGCLPLPGSPGSAMCGVLSHLSGCPGWKFCDVYCPCCRPTSSLSSVLFPGQFIPYGFRIHLSYCSQIHHKFSDGQ